jgi:hypothetical protein
VSHFTTFLGIRIFPNYRYYQLQDSPRLYPTVRDLVEKSSELKGLRSLSRKNNPITSRETSLVESKNEENLFTINEANLNMAELTQRVQELVDDTNPPSVPFRTKIRLMKDSLRQLQNRIEDKMAQLDKKLLDSSMSSREAVKFSEDENAKYLSYSDDLENVTKHSTTF